jgi:hypothetical protein
MTVQRTEIDRSARPAAGAEHVQPRRSGDQRGADRGRPQHVSPGRQPAIPAIDYRFGFLARGLSALNLATPALMSGPRVRTPMAPSIGAQDAQVDPPYAFLRVT